MPYIDLRTNTQASAKVRDALLADLLTLAAKHLDKPESVTMAHIGDGEAILFKGSSAPAAFVSVQAIGLPDVDARTALVAGVSALLEDVLAIPSDRVFVVFEDMPRDRWGVSGKILA
jgi:phenylpyruvate tautomerase